VHLYEVDNEKLFASPLYIEAVINGITNESLHIQDDSGIGLKVLTTNTEKYNTHDIIRIKTGGMLLNKNNYHFILDNPKEITNIGQGSDNTSSISLSSLVEDIHTFTSKVVHINEDELNFSTKKEKKDISSYLIEQSVTQDLKLWVNVPNGLDYDMPMSISSVTGFIVYEDENIYINIRAKNDVQE